MPNIISNDTNENELILLADNNNNNNNNNNNSNNNKMMIERDDTSPPSSSFVFPDDALEWDTIPEPLLLKIFSYLSPNNVLTAGLSCKRWNDISKDDYLWKKLFRRDFCIAQNVGIMPGSYSWYSEYKRLTYHIPIVQTDELEAHTHEVLHASFSHNGEMFATCSKDGFVIIWNSSHPISMKYSHDMKKFSWKYTQFSQFNESDTLLLVSGVHFGVPLSTSGEIAVFTVTGTSHLRCRVVNKPYDIFGTWFSDQHLISGDLHWLAHLISASVIWLNKANQEVDSEHIPIMNQMYKFYNTNASSVRSITVANCTWLDESDNDDDDDIPYVRFGGKSSASGSTSKQHEHSIHYADEFRRDYDQSDSGHQPQSSSQPTTVNANNDGIVEIDGKSNSDGCGGGGGSSSSCTDDEALDESEDLDTLCPRYLIFTTGSKTYTPHQIGFKLVKRANFPKRLDPGPSIQERVLAARQRDLLMNEQPANDPDWANFDAVADRFDEFDKLIDLHGHIIGMGLSPDHRYLYVNCRPWPDQYRISNELDPPPIAQEIDIHVIDLVTLKPIGNMLRSHKAYTPNSECFFIFLDVCDKYVASGAEDMHAYVWDRYYGICLSRYKHTNVVNSVAFNSKDPEMLVTTSDDYKIKIWRSKAKAKELNVNSNVYGMEFRKKQT